MNIKFYYSLVFFFFSSLVLFSQTQVGSDLDGEAASDQSGYSVALSGNGSRVIIGAIFNDGNGSNSGHVRVYEESGGVWTQVGSDLNGEAASDLFGESVSISSNGTRIAVGASGNDGTNGNESGHVRVYEESGGMWTQVGGDIDGEALSDRSGAAISLSADGTRVAIGAYANDGNGNGAGHVRIYEEIGGVWSQIGGDLDGEGINDNFGGAVSLSPNGLRVAIGATGNDGGGFDAGHVRVFEDVGGTWTQVGLDIDGEAAGDQSGKSVSLSSDGSRVAIGAIFNDATGTTSVGHVRVFEEIGGSWIQVGNDIDGEAASDQFGWSVSLSASGNRVAIGARFNDGNGNNAGHVRIYEEIGGTWTQVGLDIDGEASDDQSGTSVSISADGTRVGIGAILNDGNGGSAGHARVYSDLLLPIELVSFSGYDNPDGNLLEWETASESDNYGFEIQRSIDGANWDHIGFIYGHGTSFIPQSYEFVDRSPIQSMNYYRLKQVDFDGDFQYSNVIQIHRNEIGDIQIYPNPSAAWIEVYGGDVQKIDIVDCFGQVVLQENIAPHKKVEVSQLSSGTYFITLYAADQRVTKLFIRQ